MAPTIIKCGYTDCDYKSEHESEQVASLQFQSHMAVHTSKVQAPASGDSVRAKPEVEKPVLKQDITEEEWDSFTQEFRRYKRRLRTPVGQEADDLFDCCEKSLGRLLLKEDPGIIEAGEEKLLEAMKKMAVIRVAVSIRRTQLMSMKQEPGQSIREFYANAKAQASTCEYSLKCGQECCKTKPTIDYTASVVKDIIVCGLVDPEIRRDVLELEDLDKKSAIDLVGLVESKETARKAWAARNQGDVAASSTYKKEGNTPKEDPIEVKLTLKAKCSVCDVKIFQFVRNRFGRVNKVPFSKCAKCHKDSQSKGEKSEPQSRASKSEHSAIQGFLGAIESKESLTTDDELVGSTDEGYYQTSSLDGCSHFLASEAGASVRLDHHIFTKDGWQRANSLSHPVLSLKITTAQEDYKSLNIPHVSILPTNVKAVTDTGAQSCLWSRREFLSCGFALTDLIPVTHQMKAANAAPIHIDGAILLRLSGSDQAKNEIQAAVMVYISSDANHFYLSKEAMVQLGIISPNFPQIGSSFPKGSECSATDSAQLAECGCKQRLPTPGRPGSLPFEPVPENVDKMKSWLVERYSSSTFNKCPHTPIPAMEGPPMKLHIDPDAIPVSRKKPLPVPMHWQEQVEKELLRDINIGILERVPHGEPTDWCFPMVTARKSDGSPRRVVDMSPLNRFCKREAHTSKSPFQMARSVPASSHKTVLDAWNGFHLVELREEDRHYTTFATSLGLLRYKRAPQGYVSSGDGFNRRVDDIVSDVQRMERCVDDSLLHDPDTDMEGHWWRIIDFFELAGRNGIILNPEKFQFCQNTVDFAGFRISDVTVEPLPKYLDAIRQFPTPKSITDIRSWFGLVNQVAHYAQLRQVLDPFRKFLSPKTRFEWNEDLDSAFEESKGLIVEAIQEGVRIFETARRTCLRTDWSKAGIGFFLSQKHCNCESQSFGCCSDGWRITLAGSRFLTKSESNFAPVEGEALAVAWSLEQTRFFTMGCEDLIVVVDHKPLVKIFSTRTLDEITNPRLFRLKRRTLMWKFDIEYQPGKSNFFSDAVSRKPNKYAEIASLGLMGEEDLLEESYVTAIADDVDRFVAVTWERVREESLVDPEITALVQIIRKGFPATKKEMPSGTAEFWDVRDELLVSDGVALYMDRVVIPQRLRTKVISNLHSAHQGTSGMCARARSIVYWPGISRDIEKARDDCRGCHRNAPSQAKLPPAVPRVPKTPFEMIYADYFKLAGYYFLIIGDRLSGWTEIFKTKPKSGSKGLCKALRRMFSTFGRPGDLSSDGGPEFSAARTSEFLKRWGVTHTLSSAYFPQSNGRAEVAVRITKRLLEDHVGPDGSLDSDGLVVALLQLRNTPDRESNLSAAEVLFGRQLSDAMPTLDKSVSLFENRQVRHQWRDNWGEREKAIRTRMVKTCEKLEQNSRDLPALQRGDTVFIQNQNPSHGKPNKWDHEGTVVEIGDNDQYLVQVHGTGRVTLRNRRFLRKFQPTSQISEPKFPVAVRSTVQGDLPDSSAIDHPILQLPQEPDVPTKPDDIGEHPPTSPVWNVAVPTDPSPVERSSVEELPKRGRGRPKKNGSPSQSRWDPVPCSRDMQENESNAPAEQRRSTRERRQRMVYNPVDGKYVPPQH